MLLKLKEPEHMRKHYFNNYVIANVAILSLNLELGISML